MVTIVDQVYIFLYAICGGAVIAFLYDILRIKRRTIKTNIIIVNLEDILFWLVSAVLMFLLVYCTNNGEIRGYIFAGNIIGVVLYLSLLSNLIITSSMMVINFIKRVLRFIWKILTYPFKLIFKLISIPCRFIFKILSRLARFFLGKTKGATKKGYRYTRSKLKKLLKVRKKA